MLVSIIQRRSLLAFNGPSANVLSGQRGPRAQRHFNGCHDERVKPEQGYPVSSIGKKREAGQGRGKETGDRVGVRATGGEDRWHFLDRYVNRGVMERNWKKRKERGKEIGLLGPFVCHWLQINHSEDDVLTSITSEWEVIMGLVLSGH